MTMKKSIESLGEEQLKGKKVLVRSDLNVPLGNKFEITDDTKIQVACRTLKHLMEHGARVILASHLGFPEGSDPNYSMRLLEPVLSQMLGVAVKTVEDCVGTTVKTSVDGLKDGEVLLLENLRFYEEELCNDVRFAKDLASLAELFVNDSFVTSDRLHASTVKVTTFLETAVTGFLMRKELVVLSRVLAKPKIAAIVGGSTLSTKTGLIKSLLEKVDVLLLGGAIIFNFYLAQNISVGSSRVDNNPVEIASSIMEMAAKKGVTLHLPQYVVAADKFGADANEKVVDVSGSPGSLGVPADWMGLDIGTSAAKSFCDALNDYQTIIWAGPMGVFEYDRFALGTKAIAAKLAELTEKGANTIIVGGDTVAAVRKVGLADKMSFISTGERASLQLLEGEELPGVTGLLDDA